MKTRQQTKDYLKRKIQTSEKYSEEQNIYEITLDWFHCSSTMGEFIKGLIQDVEHITKLDEIITKEIQDFVYN